MQPNQVEIPVTKKYEEMVKYTQEKLKKKGEIEAAARKDKQSRESKSINFAKFMRKKLKQSLNKSQSLHDLSKSKLKQHQKSWKESKKQN